MDAKVQDSSKKFFLLFERIGSGKSTEANMLINGHLSPPHQWGKLDALDERVWNSFKQAFACVETNFVFIFTHYSVPQALEQNIQHIQVALQSCERYKTVDFPASDKPETSTAKTRRNEKVRVKVRVAPLKRLQESLQVFQLPSKGLCSRSTLKKGRIRLMGTDTSARNMVAELLVDAR
jgi:energy-coupling factor transporter ATP-binding protein EcfA2